MRTRLRVLCYGASSEREAMLAYARGWPAPIAVSIGAALRAKSPTELLDEFGPTVVLASQRERRLDFRTIVLCDVSSDPARGEACGPAWTDEHARFFRFASRQWSSKHIVVVAGERRVQLLADGALRTIVEPDVPRSLEHEADAIVEFRDGARRVRKRFDPRGAEDFCESLLAGED